MGVTFNARKDTYGAARRYSNDTVYVFSDVDIPDAVSGVITLDPDKVYEIDQILDLTDQLTVENNTVRGDGSVNNRINWNGAITGLYMRGNFELVVDDLFLGNQNQDVTLFDMDGDGPNPRRAALMLKNAVVLRDFTTLGTLQRMRVSIRDTDVLNVGGGFDMVNCTIILFELMNWLFDEGTTPAPDFCIRIRNDFAITGRRTRDVNLLNLRTNGEKTTNTDAAFFDISPNLGPNSSVLIAGCALQGEDPVAAFTVGDEFECTAFADAGGGFTTVSTPNTGSLANGDWINILRTQNYNGGHEVSNVVVNTSFDIEETFVDNPGRGTWHSGSLDHRDPRIKTRDNIGIQRSRSTMAMFQNGNATATTITTINTWEKVAFDGLADGAPLVERFALVGTGTLAEFVYHGRDKLTGTINSQMHLLASGGGASLDDFEFGWGLNGADPATVYDFNVRDVSALITRDFIFNQAFIIESGDVLSLYVRCTTDTRNVLVQDIAAFAQEI